MPWNETNAMHERVRFIHEWEKGELSMAGLCRKYGVSRPTGYKWVRRYVEHEGDLEALVDLPRTPHRHPWTTDDLIVDLVIRARRQQPTWGPRKLRERLQRANPDIELPTASTMGAILKRHGLSSTRQRRRRTPPWTDPLAHSTSPNSVWCTDFKGQFKTGDGVSCYPLTLMDACVRFLLRCQGLVDTSGLAAKPVYESAFRECGLPTAIRSDNGAPFASTGPGGLTKLSVWWVKLGIRHERIEPGKPQQNGRHERMHRTLKQETASPPRASMRAQQRAFDLFRRNYNESRPHDALAGKTPSDLYRASLRCLPEQEPRMEYPFEKDVVRVDDHGRCKWGRRTISVGAALAGEPVLFQPIDERCWEVFFGPVLLGVVDLTDSKSGLLQPRRRWKRVSTM
jgi:putative transposase